jgi:hypothetical protein
MEEHFLCEKITNKETALNTKPHIMSRENNQLLTIRKRWMKKDFKLLAKEEFMPSTREGNRVHSKGHVV